MMALTAETSIREASANILDLASEPEAYPRQFQESINGMYVACAAAGYIGSGF